MIQLLEPEDWRGVGGRTLGTVREFLEATGGPLTVAQLFPGRPILVFTGSFGTPTNPNLGLRRRVGPKNELVCSRIHGGCFATHWFTLLGNGLVRLTNANGWTYVADDGGLRAVTYDSHFALDFATYGQLMQRHDTWRAGAP